MSSAHRLPVLPFAEPAADAAAGAAADAVAKLLHALGEDTGREGPRRERLAGERPSPTSAAGSGGSFRT